MPMLAYPQLFTPVQINKLTIANRFAMAPMTRQMSPDQTPNDAVVEYYTKRARGGVGLVITEGTTLRSMESTMGDTVPKITDETVAGWRKVCDSVHSAGSKIAIQIWHVGALRRPQDTGSPAIGRQSPSGLSSPGKKKAEPITEQLIEQILEDYAQAAKASVAAGFDAIEIHGAHGYLIDQFLWQGTNERSDRWGGDMLGRATFACEVIKAIRAVIGPDFPLIIRISQWKQQEYTAKLADTPDKLGALLTKLVDAGLDSLHCSTRRFWEPEFEGSSLNFAGWAKKLTGIHTITVGSVGLSTEFIASYSNDDEAPVAVEHIAQLHESISNNEFDMVAVGRSLIANPDWVNLVREDKLKAAIGFKRPMLATLK